MSIDWNRVIEFLVEDDQVILIHSIYIEFNEFFKVNLKLFLTHDFAFNRLYIESNEQNP
jgi:hypothetical protein